MGDNELGTMLRGLREAVTPATVGLPVGSRRRTPGLRRSELATLAGISVEYLTRLEQGRDRHPSTQVLAALADALRLPSEARIRLRLAAKSAGGSLFPCQAAGPPASSVRPTVRALLDRLEPAPAVLLNRLSDVLAYTTGYERLARPLGLLDGAPPNLVRFLFTDDRARSVYQDWDCVADRQVAALKSGSLPADPHLAALADELTVVAGAPFAGRLTAATLTEADHTGVERLRHPEVGEVRLAQETLDLAGDDDQRLVVHLPADDAAAAALDRLTGRRPGGLRAVSG
ncbi:helix-turn-helix domain-containing protein [Streptomyces sp. A3M-1-3]|uniref:helix-turn-helix domain-containing protein n=1 Tax=Streptomyces sp. A3M-1-3 TaxID=2962044 RepID=UPI0020B8A813|nr:helix-turn-helix domain-containing protein [Streptomyces sp. A3M-1-3]MCP3822253.1 helix-turn-helix domain-containing protein [Streptomyces sp. A3M-1-3]